MDVKTAIEAGDVAALQRLLAANPGFVNTAIRWGKNNEILTQPLHFVCDKVFDGTLHPERAVSLAHSLIEAGADSHGHSTAGVSHHRLEIMGVIVRPL
jgi:uncharacterized protein